MDTARAPWYFSDMNTQERPQRTGAIRIPVWNLYGESRALPDVLHIERITDRAAGLDWRIAPHRHPNLHQFFLVRNGVVAVTLDGSRPDMAPPFLLSVPPGVVHGFAFSAGTDGFVLTVPLQSLPDLLGPSAMDTALARAAILPAGTALDALFERIHAEHEGAEPARAIMLRALAGELACLVLRRLDAHGAATGAGATDPRFQRFYADIQRHLRSGRTVADHAREIGISERHLSRICQAATGLPAARLIEASQMREACRMLVYSRATIAAIGYELGFDDPSYFSRVFRRVMGLTPGAYRAGFEKE
jgi:AraC family transcriptional activator of pobA